MTENHREMLEKLALPFGTNDIEWRVQSATRGNNGQVRILVLPYIDARSIMSRLDEVCGGLWKSEYHSLTVGGKEAFQCKLSIKFGDEWVYRTDGAEVSDIESVKGGHSNALKRAAVQWGIGRYLYALEGVWVPVLDKGDIYFGGKFNINGNKEYLKGYFNIPNLPAHALPKNEQSQPTASHQTRPQSQQSNQRQSNQQQPNRQQTQNQQSENKMPLTEDQKKASAIMKINTIFMDLGVPVEHVRRIFQKAVGKQYDNFKDASSEELKNLYNVIQPVYKYVTYCSEQNLSEQQIREYAQITLKTEIKSIFALFFSMSKEIADETLALVIDDIEIASKAV